MRHGWRPCMEVQPCLRPSNLPCASPPSDAAVLAALGLFVVPGAAFASNSMLASCPAQPVSTPFSQWGDNNSYFLLSGGSFEGTSDQVGWSLSGGASLTSGNEPFSRQRQRRSTVFDDPGGGSATSPFFCVDNTMSSLRFFAQQASAGGDLQVRALVQRAGGRHDRAAGRPRRQLSADLGGDAADPRRHRRLPDGQKLNVALQFTVPASAASWQIDDVYVDPFRSG